MEFGDVVVGSSASQELTLYNNSDCSLHYRLLIDQAISGPYNDEETARDVLGKIYFTTTIHVYYINTRVLLEIIRYS